MSTLRFSCRIIRWSLRLVNKLKAVIDARHGDPNELIYVRGDRKVDYGTMMRVMGRISGAGYHRVALVTNVEQDEK